MADREKVIDYLEYHIHLLYDVIPHVSRDDGEYLEAAAKTMSDALILLKAQEPVEPTWRQGIPFCGKCGRRFNRGVKYCQDCGQAVKWG